MARQYRHGDVFLAEVKKLPSKAKRVKVNGEGIVLAYGEVTGHAHRIREASGAALWDVAGQRYLVVEKPIVIDHEEHGEGMIEPGVYGVHIQREYTLGGEVRQVAD